MSTYRTNTLSARPYQVQGHQPVQYRPPPQLQLQPMTVQALRTPDQEREQQGLPKGTNKLLRKGLEKLLADDALTQAEAKEILTSDAAYTAPSADAMTQAEAKQILTSDAAYGGGGGSGAAQGLTQAEAKQILTSDAAYGGGSGAGTGAAQGISGQSVTGGTQGAGLGGPGAPGYVGAPALSGAGTTAAATTGPAVGVTSGTSAGTGLSGASLGAAQAGVLAIPAVAAYLDRKGGNKQLYAQALQDIQSGNAQQISPGLSLTSRKNTTFIGGDENELLKARMIAEQRGIATHKVGPGLVSFAANPDNARAAVDQAQGNVKVDPTTFSDYQHPSSRSFGTIPDRFRGNPMTTALRGR